jgi:hypothetical protein
MNAEQIRATLLRADRAVDRPWQLWIDGARILQPNGTNPRIDQLPIAQVNQLGMAGAVESLDVLRVRLVLDAETARRLRSAALYQVSRDQGRSKQTYTLKQSKPSRIQGAWLELILQAAIG